MNKKIKTLVFLCIIVVILLGGNLAYNYLKTHFEPELQLDIANVAPTTEESVASDYLARDFTVQDINGNEVTLSSQFGKPIVVNFWASWCPPCKEEMPAFEKIYQEMGDEITFMMIDLVDGSRETIETGTAYITAEGYTFPVYFDITQEAAYTYKIASIPTTLFINANGELVTNVIGSLDEETLRKGLDLIHTSPL